MARAGRVANRRRRRLIAPAPHSHLPTWDSSFENGLPQSYPEAERLIQSALGIFHAGHPPSHPFIADTLRGLHRLYGETTGTNWRRSRRDSMCSTTYIVPTRA